MPSTAVVDYSGRISPDQLATLNNYAGRIHYGAHVVVLSPTTSTDSTQGLALTMAQTWKLEPQGFLLVVNTHNDSAAMVAGSSLQSKGINSKFVNENLMPMRFEKEYIQGNLRGAIHSTMSGVEHRLNLTALRGDRATYNHHQTSSGLPIGLIFMSFFFFFVIMAAVMGKASPRPRRMQLKGQGDQGDADLASDLERIHQVLGGAPAVKQVPMKEFVQRASLNRNTQNSLDAVPAPGAQASHANQASAQEGNYGKQMMAQDAIAEKKILAGESRARSEYGAGNAPRKMIFEGAHASPDPNNQAAALPMPAVVEPEQRNAFEIPLYKPYEFPEDETAVPSVSSLEPAAGVPVSDSAASMNAVLNAPLNNAVGPADSGQTTDNFFKVDQYAQIMKSEPNQAAALPAWQPTAYTMPPTPVLPGAPTMPVSQFAASMNSDFTDVLNRSSSTYASQQQSGFMTSTPTDASSVSGKEAAAPGVCPQCQSEKSPDFSFCLRCGHMFV
jgi:uncharacterized membrane protein YgcG